MNDDLIQLTQRWDSRAASWDKDISKNDHYTSKTYPRFDQYAQKIVSQLPHMNAGIDLGCGTGEASKVLVGKVDNMYLLDISQEMLQIAAKKYPKAKTICASSTEIPLPENSMDIVISRGIMISHIGPKLYGLFLDELKRIVKPHGTVIFDFISNIDVNASVISAPKATFTIENMRDELYKRGFTDLHFDGDNDTREVRVSAKLG